MTEKPWRMVANHTEGWRAVGGALEVRDDALVFEPHAFDRATGGSSVVMPLADIAEIGREPAAPSLRNLFNGGLRARLAVRLRSGATELFVVWSVEQAIAELEAQLASRGATS